MWEKMVYFLLKLFIGVIFDMKSDIKYDHYSHEDKSNAITFVNLVYYLYTLKNIEISPRMREFVFLASSKDNKQDQQKVLY